MAELLIDASEIPDDLAEFFEPANDTELRDCWEINTRPFKGAHYATMPVDLAERCIKAGSSEHGACPHCGAPWVRLFRKTGLVNPAHKGSRFDIGKTGNHQDGRAQHGERETREFVGWRPACSCGTERPLSQEDLEADPSLLDGFEIEPFPPVPCVVLDPFAGAGTTWLAAQRLGRRFIGIELKPENVTMACDRVRSDKSNMTLFPI